MTMNKMSQAAKTGRPPWGEPMSQEVREVHYLFQGYAFDRFTGPQDRRIKHKAGHALSVAHREALIEDAARLEAAEAEVARKAAQVAARNEKRRAAYAAAKSLKEVTAEP